MHEVLKIGSRISVLPVIHGSGDFALEVRRVMLRESFDCVAVPLPESFQEDVENAIMRLPAPAIVTQASQPLFQTEWSPAAEMEEDDDETERELSYVPIDPCQAVIAALRIALGEHIPRAFIDLETARFEPNRNIFPDPYALKKVSVERFAAAMLPILAEPAAQQLQARILHMGQRLRELSEHFESILLVCSVLDWPWIRQAVLENRPLAPPHEPVQPAETYGADPATLIFLLGELPFITGLYERARAELEDDENLSIDGVKELLLAARENYKAELRGRARRITPHALSLCLKYVRNLSLLDRRMTPDLYSIVTAAKQTVGDQYALHVAETAREYPITHNAGEETLALGIGRGRLPGGEIVHLVNRLPGPPVSWRSCQLQRRPQQAERERWQMKWNPYSQCSWPPEDEQIENFRSHVFDRARAVLGADLAKTEKFTTSIKDGIDIRDTLRNWHTGDIYVKELPPDRGRLDCAVMLFDSPADPRDYPWRTTWFAEHEEESTLAFYATNFQEQLIGPGIGLATYGGALFLFPPVSIPDIWTDARLDFAETLEERLLAAACEHSGSPHIALLSPLPPGPGWRRLVRRYKKHLVHIPLGHFSESTVAQLRLVHVLNGHQVRSYASHFIRKA